jgi:hypothetical protein
MLFAEGHWRGTECILGKQASHSARGWYFHNHQISSTRGFYTGASGPQLKAGHRMHGGK